MNLMKISNASMPVTHNTTRHDMKSMHRLHPLLLAMMVGLFLPNAYAGGRIDLLEGSVSVTSSDGQLRVPHKGSRIEAGDAITTGRDGEMHVHMDDNGLIAVRTGTSLRIEAYKANGGEDDSAVFRLLRGSLRSVTGWIGKNHPQKYAVRTASATIGIRGTDHETLVVVEGDMEGAEAGTYDKVNSGETEMATPAGTLRILPGQSAFTPKVGSQPPRLLPAVPPFFATTGNDSLFENSKRVLESSRDERLKEKQKDNVRNGADRNGRAQIGDPQDARKALAALEQTLRAFEAGDVALLRQRLDPAMIGFQQLLDQITAESNACKQMRVHLMNTQVQAGPDIAVVQTGWEKRCLLLPALTPQLTSGHTTVLLHLGPRGWTLAAITAGNMLQGSSTIRARPRVLPAENPGLPASAPTSAPAAPTPPPPAPAPPPALTPTPSTPPTPPPPPAAPSVPAADPRVAEPVPPPATPVVPRGSPTTPPPPSPRPAPSPAPRR